MSYDDWFDKVQEWKEATYTTTAMVRDDIVKGRYKPKLPSQGFKTTFDDPLDIQYSMGFKDRKHSLSYETMKRVANSLSIVAAIILTRQNQISSFAVPYRLTKSLGFVIKHKDPGKLTTKGEREMIADLEKFIYNCGHSEPNPHNKGFRRDDFETFLKKIVRDTLTFDQVAAEIVPSRDGTPYEFMAIDASTIRIADDGNSSLSPLDNFHNRPLVASHDWHKKNYKGPFSTLAGQGTKEDPAYAQVINGQIRNVYTEDELIFGIRNPRTDLYVQGYGYSEIEQLISIITATLYAEEYNRKFFSQGSAPMGILDIRGDSMTPDQLEAFKRQWRANLTGVEGSWKTPILQSEQGVNWINLKSTNRDMEYGAWLEYLLKIMCAVFVIDPAELNFDISGGVQQTPLFESSSEWKLKASRDRGLKPLLRFIAKLINDHVIAKIDDHFMFDFVGLDELTEQEKHELRQEQVQSYKTLNEIRRADDLPDVEGGDMILNPTYIQALQVRQQLEQEKQQQQTAQQAGAAQPTGGQEEGAPDMEEGQQQDQGVPQYADQFTKSLSPKKLEITIEEDYDEWVDIWRD